MKEVDPDKLHPDFERILSVKPHPLQHLYRETRKAVLRIHPDSNELLYHTHALSSVYSVSSQLKHAFCHIPVYETHLNLGFNYGTELDDPAGLLTGTGAKIRHVPLKSSEELDEPELIALIRRAVDHATARADGSPSDTRRMISKIR